MFDKLLAQLSLKRSIILGVLIVGVALVIRFSRDDSTPGPSPPLDPLTTEGLIYHLPHGFLIEVPAENSLLTFIAVEYPIGHSVVATTTNQPVQDSLVFGVLYIRDSYADLSEIQGDTLIYNIQQLSINRVRLKREHGPLLAAVLEPEKPILFEQIRRFDESRILSEQNTRAANKILLEPGRFAASYILNGQTVSHGQPQL